MKVKLKNYEVINAYKALDSLLTMKGFDTPTQYKFCKNMNLLKPLFDSYSKVEYELLMNCVIKDENLNIKTYDEDELPNHKKGDPKFTPKKEIEFIKGKNELLQCENEIEVHLIKLSELKNILEDGTLLFPISFLINDEE